MDVPRNNSSLLIFFARTKHSFELVNLSPSSIRARMEINAKEGITPPPPLCIFSIRLLLLFSFFFSFLFLQSETNIPDTFMKLFSTEKNVLLRIETLGQPLVTRPFSPRRLSFLFRPETQRERERCVIRHFEQQKEGRKNGIETRKFDKSLKINFFVYTYTTGWRHHFFQISHQPEIFFGSRLGNTLFSSRSLLPGIVLNRSKCRVEQFLWPNFFPRGSSSMDVFCKTLLLLKIFKQDTSLFQILWNNILHYTNRSIELMKWQVFLTELLYLYSSFSVCARRIRFRSKRRGNNYNRNKLKYIY